jgi:hypothetical protein
MLHDFITDHREELIALTRAKVARRIAPTPTELELASGVHRGLQTFAFRPRSPAICDSRAEGPFAQAQGCGGRLQVWALLGQLVDVCPASPSPAMLVTLLCDAFKGLRGVLTGLPVRTGTESA